jgi:Lon protease-like protein
MTRLPLFPLHAVLVPGVALPLHIFEPRYRVMVGRCLNRGEPFGVVLIEAGSETGQPVPRVASVGTTARISQASRYPDGRLDIVTVGARRFRIDALHTAEEPYLVGDVTMIDEALGDRDQAARLAERVGAAFLRYLELLQPALATDDGPEIEVEVEVEAPEDTIDDDPVPIEIPGVPDVTHRASVERVLDTAGLDDDQRRQLLMAAARRLTSTTAPTELSFLVTGLVQVPLASRQAMLEADDTETRLRALEGVLRRENELLSRQLRPLVLETRASPLRRN